MVRRFVELSKDIYCNEFYGHGCWKHVMFALMAVCWIMPCAVLAFDIYVFNTCNHVNAVKLASYQLVHATLIGCPREGQLIGLQNICNG